MACPACWSCPVICRIRRSCIVWRRQSGRAAEPWWTFCPWGTQQVERWACALSRIMCVSSGTALSYLAYQPHSEIRYLGMHTVTYRYNAHCRLAGFWRILTGNYAPTLDVGGHDSNIVLPMLGRFGSPQPVPAGPVLSVSVSSSSKASTHLETAAPP
jgi:hypothetical protein